MAAPRVEQHVTFDSFGFDEWIVEQCKVMGMKTPTLIQAHCIKPILEGRNVAGCARTGSGKTAAFALPILQALAKHMSGIFALVLAPTRELASQIADHFVALGSPIKTRVALVIGGRDKVAEALALSKKPHIVVATPGRLVDHLNTTTDFSLKNLKFFVMDEADQLLREVEGEKKTFLADLKRIHEELPEPRQTLMFSATMTPNLMVALEANEGKPFVWQEEATIATVDSLDQRCVLVPSHVKDAYLVYILNKYLEENKYSLVIDFISTCRWCQILGMALTELGIDCVVLHSVMKQKQRLASLAMFKSHRVRVMIATDVANRGLDIPTVDLVMNHSVPTSHEKYLHRVGRTARMGRYGVSITMVNQFELNLLAAIEKSVGKEMTKFKVDDAAVAKIAETVALYRREAELKLEYGEFGEAKESNKVRQILAEGKDPEKEEAARRKRAKQRRKELKRTEVKVSDSESGPSHQTDSVPEQEELEKVNKRQSPEISDSTSIANKIQRTKNKEKLSNEKLKKKKTEEDVYEKTNEVEKQEETRSGLINNIIGKNWCV